MKVPNKYDKELEEARNAVSAASAARAPWSAVSAASAASAPWTAVSAARYARAPRAEELEYQINRVLEVLE